MQRSIVHTSSGKALLLFADADGLEDPAGISLASRASSPPLRVTRWRHLAGEVVGLKADL